MAQEITGRELIIALKKAAAWHTPVACGVGDGLLVLQDSFKITNKLELDDSAGQNFITQADPGEDNLAGSPNGYLRYEGFDVALALVMGQSAGAPAQQEATAAYANTYSMASNIRGLFGTMALQKLANKVWEFPSVKLHGFKITAMTNKPAQITFDAIADKLDRASATNTTVTMAAVTYPDKSNRVFMNKDTVVRINDRDGAALGAGDEINPSSIEITMQRPMDTEAVSGQDGLDEPDDNGFPVVTVVLKFPRYDAANDAFFDDWNASTPKKLEILFKGKLIEGTYYYQQKFSFCNVKADNPQAPVNGAGKIPFTVTLQAMGAEAAPTGMSFTQPMQIEVINKRTTDPLA